MREMTRESQFETGAAAPVGQVLTSSPSEETLVIISLLMRLYDIQMAHLSAVDENRANQIYEAHEKGDHFNPEIFIPSLED